MARLRAEFCNSQIRAADGGTRSPKVDAAWAQIVAELGFRQLSVSDLEIIFQRYGIDLDARKLVAELEARKLSIGSVSLEQIIHWFTRQAADDVAAQEAVQVLLGKMFSDPAIVVENVATSLRKPLADAIITVDGVSFSFARIVADASSPIDVVSFAINKVFSDAVTAADAAIVGMFDEQTLSDGLTTIDVANLGLTKSITDTASAVDAFAFVMDLGPYPRSQLNGYPIGDFTLGD